MSRCARCGLEQEAGELSHFGECALPRERQDACRDRELANLRSLLRSVTGNLERAAELLQSDTQISIDEMRQAAREIDVVLEVLS
jgi:hypothetical protein